MEIGVYLTKSVNDIFDKMEGISAQSRKIKRIINTIREKFSNAPLYQEKVVLTPDNLDLENLTKILGEYFFGSRKDTKNNFEDFIIIFNNLAGKNKRTSTEKTKPEINTEEKEKELKQDIKSIRMELSDTLWSVLEQLSQKDDQVCWTFVNFIEHEQKKPGSNLLAIRHLDIDDDNPSLFKATFVNGKKTRIPTFNFFKQYFGNKFSNIEINLFCEDLKKVVLALTYEPGDVIAVPDFKFNPKDVRSTFISLVTETYPRGYEEEVVPFLGPGLTKDRWGNYYTIVGNSDTMFTCHIDTVSIKTKINLISRIKDEQEIISSDGTTILGADDKAGVTVLLYMIAHKVPGVYYFFVGEESGGIGSQSVSDNIAKIPHLRNIKKCVSFDRRNYYSVITSQMATECCSENFAKALCKELNKSGLKMGLDPTGIFTDSANFIEQIPECTNVSVGYFNEHTFKEALNVTFLKKLAEACIKVNWSGLPVERPTEITADVYESWEELLKIIDETGLHSEMKVAGNKQKLILKLDLQDALFDEVFIDMSNLEYIFQEMMLQPKITFENTLIKFELQ